MTMKRTGLLAACAAMAILAGCDEAGTGPVDGARLSLSLSAASTTQPSVRANQIPVGDGAGRTIDITRVQLVMKEVELKRVEDRDCEGSDDSCEKFEAGATLVTLPIGGGVVTPFTEAIAPGTYDELELKIAEPEDDNGERAAFYAAHPEWPRRATVRVTGTFDNGAGAQPFDVFLGVNAKVEREISPPLVVDASTDPQSVNLTLAVDVESWFRDRAGSFIDPRSIATSPALLAAVNNNVRASFRALRDDDRNGDDDHRGRGRGGDDAPGDDYGGRGGSGNGGNGGRG